MARTTITTNDHLITAMLGQLDEYSIENKFGRNSAVGTSTLEPLTTSGTYQTPKTLTTLQVSSDNVNDTAAGTGARTVEVIGLGADFDEVSEVVTMNGTTPVVLSTQFYRVYRVRVMESGTYADQLSASHTGTITLEESDNTVWAQIGVLDSVFGAGQSQIGVVSIPKGKNALVLGKNLTVESTKSINAYFFVREGINVVEAPYTAMQLKEMEEGITDNFQMIMPAPMTYVTGPADIGFMAKGTQTPASVSVDFQLLVFDK